MDFHKFGYLEHYRLLDETYHSVSPSQPELEQELQECKDQASEFGLDLLSAKFGPGKMTKFALGEYLYLLGSRELLRGGDFKTSERYNFDKWESTMKQVAKDAVYQASSLDEFCGLIKARAPDDLQNLQCYA